MGWTWYAATCFKPNGSIDRLREVEKEIADGYTILKSSMVGATYYGALRKDGTDKAYALVVLTSVDKKSWANFGCKFMDETYGPVEKQCPMSILNLLTPTDDDWANQWREKCREYHRQKNLKSKHVDMADRTIVS